MQVELAEQREPIDGKEPQREPQATRWVIRPRALGRLALWQPSADEPAEVDRSQLRAEGDQLRRLPQVVLQLRRAFARDRRLPCQLSYEAYMRCGIGVCGSCAVGGCLVCRDGPVFERPTVSSRGADLPER